MITIKKPFIEHEGEYASLKCEIIIQDPTSENARGGVIFFKVKNEYAPYLTYERSDAYIIGLLKYAMSNKHDIQCETPVSETLLFNLDTFFIDSLVSNSKNLYRTKIYADIASDVLPNDGAVGTGASMGIDSFHSIINHSKSRFPQHDITHLSFHNVGASYGSGSSVYKERLHNAEMFCKEYGYKLVVSDSNIQDVIWQDHYLTHHYTSGFAIFCLQKLWKVYYYASSSPYSEFTLKNNDLYAPGRYELLTVYAFSTDILKIYSEGATKNRLEKTHLVADSPLSYKYLNVCMIQGHNCGECEKCIHTMTMLDAIGSLNNYSSVFPVDKYYNNYDYYMGRIYYYHKRGLHAFDSIYPHFKDKITFKAKLNALKYTFNLIKSKFRK